MDFLGLEVVNWVFLLGLGEGEGVFFVVRGLGSISLGWGGDGVGRGGSVV